MSPASRMMLRIQVSRGRAAIGAIACVRPSGRRISHTRAGRDFLNGHVVPYGLTKHPGDVVHGKRDSPLFHRRLSRKWTVPLFCPPSPRSAAARQVLHGLLRPTGAGTPVRRRALRAASPGYSDLRPVECCLRRRGERARGHAVRTVDSSGPRHVISPPPYTRAGSTLITDSSEPRYRAGVERADALARAPRTGQSGPRP